MKIIKQFLCEIFLNHKWIGQGWDIHTPDFNHTRLWYECSHCSKRKYSDMDKSEFHNYYTQSLLEYDQYKF